MLNAPKSAAAPGAIPQNTNFATKATALPNILDVNQVFNRTGTAGTFMNPADLAEKA
jgi:hypothetical protein